MTVPTRLVWFVDVERDEARRLAERELADPIYDDDPSLLERFLEWLAQAFEGSAVSLGGLLGDWGALALLLPIALIVAVVLWRFGPMARRATRGARPLFGTEKRTAAEYRRAADDAFTAEDWTTSVLERFRAIAAGLEERAVLTTKAGRTADEAAREAGELLPGLAERLATGAVAFDDVRYGERGATRDEATTMHELERDVLSARISDRPTEAGPMPAVPR